jgi:hypothetical protein
MKLRSSLALYGSLRRAATPEQASVSAFGFSRSWMRERFPCRPLWPDEISDRFGCSRCQGGGVAVDQIPTFHCGLRREAGRVSPLNDE